MKMQIRFFIKEKFRSTSNEDVDQFFFIKEKFRSTSNEDVYQFLA